MQFKIEKEITFQESFRNKSVIGKFDLDIKNYKEIFSTCVDNIKNNEERCYMIRASSKNAVDLFPDESLDFVYIDANHKYDFVLIFMYRKNIYES